MIRKMVISDIPLMISLGAEMHQESRYSNLDFDPNRLWSLGEQIIKTPDNYLAAVYEKNNKIVGFCVGYVAPHFFGNDLTSGDFAIYVLPEHRKGMVGVKLIKTYDEWCVAKGVKEPMLGVSAGITPERIGKLYKRMGYTETYTIYKKPEKTS
jgi:GNAT superfamily N-acetyltransferase